MKAKSLQNYTQIHTPVMISEVTNYLNLQPDGIYLDGTIGAGGHATEILTQLSIKGRLIGLDRDAEALDICNKRFGASALPIITCKSSYDNFPKVIGELGISKLDGILLDLGLSSMQLNSETRGFSYNSSGALDMRFDSEQSNTAADLINQISEKELSNIIFEFGEERHSRKIAKSIKSIKNLLTANDLKEAIRKATPPHKRNKSLARVFQAIRIAVNSELEKLRIFLNIFIDYLAAGGRIIIMSYHSIEDRMVKHAFRSLKQSGKLDVLTKKPVIPSATEQNNNNRSRSAKLRAAERLI